MNKVKISVIVNCYNGEKFIFKSVNSILNQTHSNYEVIFLIMLQQIIAKI